MPSLYPALSNPSSPNSSSPISPLASIEDSVPPDLPEECDIAIVGGGIVGTTLAAALCQSGLKVVLIEAQPQSVAVAKGQAYAISLLSSHIFQGIGVWDRIRPLIAPFRKIRLSDADDPGVVWFQPEDLQTEVLGYVAEHRALLESLQSFLATECPTVRWLCPARLVETTYGRDRAELTVEMDGNRHQLRSRLVVAADGSRSRIREQAGIRTLGWQYPQSCIVATIAPEQPHQNIAYERFWPSGPFAILPLPNNRCRIVWTAPHNKAKALMELDDWQFLAELRSCYGDQMGFLRLEGKRFLFPVRLMQSCCYAQHRLALVGDAAHCCHPVGGQGLNLGIRDAAALAQILQTAHQRQQDIGSLSVLRSYARWRKRENWAILGFTDLLVRFFSNNVWPLVQIRRFGLWLLRQVPFCKRLALKLMTGLLGRSPALAQR